MKNFVVFGLVCFAVSCGSQEKSPSRTVSSEKSSGSESVAPVQQEKGLAAVINPSSFESPPVSYTFLDTPDANLCVDAFIRQGITLPVDTVARTINVTNVRVGGVSLQDMGSSPVAVLNIVRLQNNCSNTTFQFLNPVGFYCIVRNNAVYSNVTIQRRCSAGLAELEPMTHVTVNQAPRSCGLFGWFCRDRGLDGQGTQTSYNSQITETPCIP